MRAILIDPHTKTVTEVENSGQLHDIYAALGCDTIDAVYLEGSYTGHFLYVDDNGLTYNEPLPVFVWTGFHQPLAGKAIMFKSNEDGDNIAADMPIGVAWAHVTFPALEVEDIKTRSYTREDGTFVIENRPFFKRTGKD